MIKRRPKGRIDYSEVINGTERNFDRAVRFDVIDGFVGISQFGTKPPIYTERILLTKRQFIELVKFVSGKK